MLAERTKPLRAALALILGLAGIAAGVAAAPPASAVGDDGTVHLAVVVPLVVPESTDPFIDSATLELYTGPFGVLTRQLDAVIDRPVAIAVDPRIIASIRILGSSAPASATAWLARLGAATNETFALTYADTDVTLSTQAGSQTVPAPESFDFAIDPSLFAEVSEQTPAPTPDPAPTAPTLPTSDTLLEWPYTLDEIVWPREGTVVAGDLSALSASDFSTTLLSSSNVARDGDNPLATVGSSTAAVSDDVVSGALREAAASFTNEQWDASMATLTTALTAASDTVLATLDREGAIGGSRLAETLDALQANPAVTFTSFADLLAGSASAASLVDLPQDTARVAQVTRMLEATAAEERFAPVAADPLAITAPRRLQLLALLSTVWNSDPAGWGTATDTFLADSEALRNSVQVVVSSSFNLLADSASLPVSVTNALDQPVTVYITVRPQTALLAVTDSRVKLVVEPNSQGKGQVPVQAISNGTVQVLITLASGTGVQIGPPTTSEINVQAGWETPIVLVIASLVVLVFAVGIVRNILRRRKPAAESSDD